MDAGSIQTRGIDTGKRTQTRPCRHKHNGLGRRAPNELAMPVAGNYQQRQGWGHHWSRSTKDDKAEVIGVVAVGAQLLVGKQTIRKG